MLEQTRTYTVAQVNATYALEEKTIQDDRRRHLEKPDVTYFLK